MKTTGWIMGITTLAFTLCAGNAQTLRDTTLTAETFLSTGVSQPINIKFLNPANTSEAFVCEKGTGRVKYLVNGVVAATLLDLPVENSNERGLLGMVLDPRFEENGYVYFYYSNTGFEGGTWLENRVERYRWTGTALVEPTLIIAFPRDPTQPNGPSHNGGVMAFGPDGKLYGVTGDLTRGRFSNPRIEQNTGSVNAAGVGGIFRLNPDGTIPADNPFINHPLPAIQRLWAYGLRNGFGLTFDPLTGRLWHTDNGPDQYDEVNLIGKGMNGGHSMIMGPDSRDAVGDWNQFTPRGVSDLVMLDGAYYGDPQFSWLQPVGVSGITFLRSARFDTGTRDQCIVGETNFARIHMLPMNASRDGFALTGVLADLVADSTDERNLLTFGQSFSVTVDHQIGPDGYLYMCSIYTNRILRVRPINPPTIVNGDSRLANFSGIPLNIPLLLTIKNGNTTVQTVNTTLDAFGKFSVRLNNAGTYTVIAKAGSWLSKRFDNVSVSSGGYVFLRLPLTWNGDVNGDNRIDDEDLLEVLFNFGGSLSDLNGDGEVNDEDLLIVLFNFGQQGEE